MNNIEFKSKVEKFFNKFAKKDSLKIDGFDCFIDNSIKTYEYVVSYVGKKFTAKIYYNTDNYEFVPVSFNALSGNSDGFIWEFSDKDLGVVLSCLRSRRGNAIKMYKDCEKLDEKFNQYLD